jgi:hypothetical protein
MPGYTQIPHINDGWVEVNSAWSYASATTITVPSGAASLYQIGDKIKLTQATDKYYIVTVVADALLTVTGGTDYTVANSPIFRSYYSKADVPLGFPDYFHYTATIAGFSANPTMQTTFFVKGRMCFLTFCSSANGTSNATTYTITLPITCKTDAALGTVKNACQVVNDGTVQAGVCYIASAGTVCNIKKIDESNFTSSGDKSASGQIIYPI